MRYLLVPTGSGTSIGFILIATGKGLQVVGTGLEVYQDIKDGHGYSAGIKVAIFASEFLPTGKLEQLLEIGGGNTILKLMLNTETEISKKLIEKGVENIEKKD